MIDINALRKMFVGRRVRITHTGNHLGTTIGVCKAIHSTPGGLTPFDIELRNNSRYGFTPTTVTAQSCDGVMGGIAGGNRKIEVSAR